LRAVALHPDVIVVTSALLHVNCVIVRGGVEGERVQAGAVEGSHAGAAQHAGAIANAGETFVIDSPVLPDELDALPALVDQARLPAPSGLLATHGDWDHLLGRLAFPGLALGCAETTAERLHAAPGEAQRELRTFDEQLAIERPHPLALGSVQALPVPGRCELGDRELELHPTDGHTIDGMAIWIPWARVLVAGDYLSTVELPVLNEPGGLDAYMETLARLRSLVPHAQYVVPGHGQVLDSARARAVLDEDLTYLGTLAKMGDKAELPPGRGGAVQRRLHRENLLAL